MHHGGRTCLPPVRRKAGGATGNARSARKPWRISHQGRLSAVAAELLRREGERELSRKWKTLWAADDPGSSYVVRRREWATSGHDGLRRNHGTTHGGSDGGGGEISGSSEVRGSHGLRLRSARPRPSPGAGGCSSSAERFRLRHVPGAGRAIC